MQPTFPCSNMSGRRGVCQTIMKKLGGERVCAVFFSFFFLIHPLQEKMIEGAFHALSSTHADTGSTEPVQRSGWRVVLQHSFVAKIMPYLPRLLIQSVMRLPLVTRNYCQECVTTFVPARHFSPERSAIGDRTRVQRVRGAAPHHGTSHPVC